MSQSISSPLPSTWRIPLFYARFDDSQASDASAAQRTLIIGSAGETLPEVPFPAFSVAAVRNTLAPGCQLAQAYADYVANDPDGEVWLLPVSIQEGSTAASGTVVITGTATAAGVLALYIAGQVVDVPVASGASATAIGANIATAVNALPNVPVGAAAADGTVTLTANNLGLLGNQIDVRLNYYGAANGEATPAGITVAISAMSGGTLGPSLANIDSIVGDQAFDFVVSPYLDSANQEAVSTWFSNSSGRWSPTRQSFGGVFSAISASASALETLGEGLDDPHLVVFGETGSPTPPWSMAAIFAGAAAASLRNQASQPLQTLVLQNMLAPAPDSQNSITTINTLLNNGIACAKYAADGTAQIVRAVTTYQTNQYGQADTSYLDCETLYTLMAVTRAIGAMFIANFPRAILVPDRTPVGPGVSVITPSLALGSIYALYEQLELQGLVNNAAAMQAATTASISTTDPTRLEITWAPYLSTGCRIIDLVNQFRLLQPAAA